MDDSTAADKNVMATNHDCKRITLLVLGDGDFSFSFDWARYLVHNLRIFPGYNIHLMATGLDTEDALLAKYKDAAFLLKRLKGLDKTSRHNHDAVTTSVTSESNFSKSIVAGSSNNTRDEKLSFRVSIHHGVNAIYQPGQPTSITSLGNWCAQHVVFHHPHLGTEDAALHAQFLCHLFYSVAMVWLAKDDHHHPDIRNNEKIDIRLLANCFHLTLIKGQFTRWKCAEAAERHGMVLVNRRPFCPPRVEHPYYQHRRHQTGKSFVARAPEGSETFTFVRQTSLSAKVPSKGTVEGDGTDGAASANTDNRARKVKVAKLVAMLLGGTKLDSESPTTINLGDGISCDAYPCPYCDKSFKEERSRKCHVKAVHGGDASKKRKRQGDVAFDCSLCRAEDGGPRLFQSLEALEAHRQAKHLAEHSEIKPDWLKIKTTATMNSTKGILDFGCCDICGFKFTNITSQEDHRTMFVPSDVGSNANRLDPFPFQCTYCKKAFRENRAQKQHENFCKAKPAS